MVTHANGLFGLESRHVRSVAWGNIPDFDRGTDTVSRSKPEKPAENIYTILQAK